jgi:hypothetical protein
VKVSSEQQPDRGRSLSETPAPERTPNSARMHTELPRHPSERDASNRERLGLSRIHPVFRGAADVPTLRPSSPNPGHHPLSDEIPLELRDRREDVEE